MLFLAKFVKKYAMKTLAMRNKLYKFIETAEEKRIKAIYNLFEKEMEEIEWDYTDDFKKELDSRNDHYLNGGKMITAGEADRRLHKVMSKLRVK
jgi:hypothetical protein